MPNFGYWQFKKRSMKETVETIKDNNGNTVAIVIYKKFKKEGVNFLTPENFSQQVAFIAHASGKVIQAHTHRKVKREVQETQETLLIKRGSIKVNLYDVEGNYLDSRILKKGDLVLLVSGGHGFEVLKDIEMIEVKQGPYSGPEDKIILKGIEQQK